MNAAVAVCTVSLKPCIVCGLQLLVHEAFMFCRMKAAVAYSGLKQLVYEAFIYVLQE
jgi:hypothetical protein